LRIFEQFYEPNLRIGLFGIGLDTYWPQFKGLKRRLEGYIHIVERKLVRPDVEVVNLGLIDNPKKALEAGTSSVQRTWM